MTKDELIDTVLKWYEADAAMYASNETREIVDSIVLAADADRILAMAIEEYRAERQ